MLSLKNYFHFKNRMLFTAVLLGLMVVRPLPVFAAKPVGPFCKAAFGQDDLSKSSAVVLNKDKIPLTVDEWKQVDRIFAQSPTVVQNHGDIADHHLSVAMWVSNNPAPKVLGENGRAMVEILGSPKMMELYKAILNDPRPLFIRRLQGNYMESADYNHAHTDDEDDPSYSLAVIIYLTDPRAYKGGELIITKDNIVVRPERRSLVAIRGDTEHAVHPVEASPGRGRRSIVVLLGHHDGPNPKFR
jgi:hypothetical protein